MAKARRIDELDSPLHTATELEAYLKRVQDLYKDLYMELSWGAEVLQKNLSTIPVADSKHQGGVRGSTVSKIRARKVANHLKRASEASKYAGGEAVKTWREFTRSFAPEIEAIRQKRQTRPSFRVNE
jgi:hypothetical protein